MKSTQFLMLVPVLALSVMAQQGPDTLWTRRYGGSGDDVARCVRQTIDGGYIVAGSTTSYGAGLAYMYIVKTDANGDTLWTCTCGGAADDHALSVVEGSDGGYLIAGWTTSFGVGEEDVYLVKIDSLGDTLWTRTYGGNYDDRAQSLARTAGNGYIMGGYKALAEFHYRMWLMHVNVNGYLNWEQTYIGNPLDGYSKGFSARQTSDGGYIFAGEANDDIGATEFYLVKTAGGGALQWSHMYGEDHDDRAYDVQQTFDGGYIAVGVSLYDIYVLKALSDGGEDWTRSYGGSNRDEAYSIQQTNDGGYVYAGYTMRFGPGGKEFYFAKIDSVGDTLWTCTLGEDFDDVAYSVQQTSDEGYIVAGSILTYGRGDDFYLVKTEPDGSSGASGKSERIIPWTFTLHPLYPNPFNSCVTIPFEVISGLADRINLRIFNVLGQEVADLTREARNALSGRTGERYEVMWDGKDALGLDAVSGIYLIEMRCESVRQTQKAVLLR